MLIEFRLRRAALEDHAALKVFLQQAHFVYRHLDWRSPLEWLGNQPFWLLQSQDGIEAALACPPDPPQVAWIRLFACSRREHPSEAWRALFPRVREALPASITIAALGLRPWFGQLLEEAGFTIHQRVVMLQRNLTLPLPALEQVPDLHIRSMDLTDLQAVENIDAQAFEALWHNSAGDIYRSWRQAAYASVAVVNRQVIGFQFSTLGAFNAHLARLAVHPQWQHRGIGRALLMDAIAFFTRQHVPQMTVNTQHNNFASLTLYQQAGFHLTGEDYNVYLYNS